MKRLGIPRPPCKPGRGEGAPRSRQSKSAPRQLLEGDNSMLWRLASAVWPEHVFGTF